MVSQNLLIKIFSYLAEFLLLSSFNKINENFKVEVQQMNFVIHLIILLQYNVILSSKNPSDKIWSNKFQN